MADLVFKQLINGEVSVERLLTWISHDVNADDFAVSQGEFLAHFLNYLHEEAPCFDSRGHDVAKLAHTPKSIRRADVSRPKRRSALFKDTTTAQSDVSPISPIYRRPHQAVKSRSELCLGDFITQTPKLSSKKKTKSLESPGNDSSELKKTRRINPTSIKKAPMNTPTHSNHFNFQAAESDKFSESSERFKNFNLATRNVGDSVKFERNEIQPNFELVTHRSSLDCLVKLYTFLLKHNYVLNLTSELYFLISLLLAKQYDDVPINTERIFATIHNLTYFAVKTLEQLRNILVILDKPTIKLLVLNERISDVLKSLLNTCHNDEVRADLVEARFNCEVVCFDSETDNREHFPCDQSFHSFRKQRDLFYEILRVWELNRACEGWCFSVTLGGKIRSLFNLNHEAANYRHFARLFKSQLLNQCSATNEEGVSESQLTSVITSLPNINSEKLTRLKNRLVTKTTTNGINAPPQFAGQQEFYKEFIVCAANFSFNMHLRDVLVRDLIELNEQRGENAVVDSQAKKSFVLCVKSMRLLGKYLGFIESLPYRSSKQQIDTDLTLRYHLQPNFDLKSILHSAVINNTLALSIPWIVKYLAMMDAATLRLPYFEHLYDELFAIYHQLGFTTHDLLVKLCVGWLFELAHFPSELYYAWCTKKAPNGGGGGNVVAAANQTSSSSSSSSSDIVDKSIIYVCCPFLHEFKRLLQYNTRSATSSLKHITPVTSLDDNIAINANRKLKLQLEEAFLNAHSISMRKTIEFVSERISSACVKAIFNRILPEFKRQASDDFKIKIKDAAVGFDDLEEKQTQEHLQRVCAEEIDNALARLKQRCTDEMHRHIDEKVANALQLLLSDDDLQATRNVCTAISKRMCRERIHQWMQLHIKDGVFRKDFNQELSRVLENKVQVERKFVFALPSHGREGSHNPNTLSGCNVVEKLRSTIIEVLERPKDVTQEQIDLLLQEITRSLNERCDINDSLINLINHLSCELCLIIVAYRTDLYTKVIKAFLPFWKAHVTNFGGGVFDNLLCPRNIRLLGARTLAWDTYAAFLTALLQHDCLDCDCLERQCLAVYQFDWDEATLKRLSSCFLDIVAGINRLQLPHEKFAALLSFLSGFCCDLESDY